MNRRSIFKSLLSAVAASALEVCGWKMPRINFKGMFEERDPMYYYRTAIYDPTYGGMPRAIDIIRDNLEGKPFPEGMGNNYRAVNTKLSDQQVRSNE